MSDEIKWKDIPKYEGNYKISSDGDIFSNYRNILMKQQIVGGYKTVGLSLRGVSKTLCVHILVAGTFIPTDDDNLIVNHKNGDKLDNRLPNLEWITHLGNIEHAIENKLFIRPTRPVIQHFPDGTIKIYNSMKDAEQVTGVWASTIRDCCKSGREIKKGKGKGFRWSYVKEKENYPVPNTAKEIPILNFYLITRDGKIYSNLSNKWISINLKDSGYFVVTIDNKRYFIHKLVALTFIPNPDNLPHVDHIDGNKENNNVENLRWVNRSQNTIYANELGNNRVKPVIQLTTDGQFVKRFKSATEAAKELNISISGISTVIHGRQKTAGGYLWKHEDMEYQMTTYIDK